MFRRRCLKGFAPLAVAAGLAFAVSADAAETSASLISSGWAVVDKTETLEQRPGVAPYETLVREVLVTRLILEKGGARRVCVSEYDSQREKYEESCAPAD